MDQVDVATPDDATGEQILQAVREAIDAEVDRVHHPGPRPWDTEAWHAYAPLTDGGSSQEKAHDSPLPPGPASGAPGHPVYDPEAWRWFELVDLAYLPALVLVQFAWADPQTPELHYVAAINVPTSDSSFAASVVRSSLRGRLAPGWRERAQRTWLGSDRVLISRRARQPRVQEAEERIRDEIWNQPRRS